MSESLSRSPWPSLRAACAFCTDRCTLISDSTSLDCWSAVALAFSESTRFSCAARSWMKARASCVASCSRRTATSSSGGIAGSPRRTSHTRRFCRRYLRDDAQFEGHIPAFHLDENRNVGVVLVLGNLHFGAVLNDIALGINRE